MISVIIPCYNSAEFIRDAIDSALQQTYQDYEIIVVNDGSTDESIQIIESYGDKVRLISQENRGLSGARNTGIREAKGDWVAFLDADDIWKPNKLEIQLQVALEKNYEFISTNSETIDENGHLIKSELQEEHKQDREITYQDVFQYNFVCVASVLIKKKILMDVGLFKEDLYTAEDYDMWLRILPETKGYRIAQQLVLYREHPGGLSKKIDEHIEGIKRVLRESYELHHHLLKDSSLKDRFAKLYFDLGHKYFHSNDMVTARKLFKQGAACSPLTKNVIYYGISLFPLRVVGFIRNIKRMEAC